MPKGLVFFLAVGMLFVVASPARATSIPFSDVFNPTDVLFDGQSGVDCTGSNTLLVDSTSAGTCESLKWTQTLPGYDSNTDTLTHAKLTLTAYNDRSNNNQDFTLLLDLLPPFTRSVTDTATLASPDKFEFTVLGQLADGILNITLMSQNGNHTFYFAQSQLEADAERPTGGSGDVGALTSMPEPGTMLLLGTGTAAWTTRRLQRRQR